MKTNKNRIVNDFPCRQGIVFKLKLGKRGGKNKAKAIFIILIAMFMIFPLVSAALTDGLVSYYKMDEASGSVLDAEGDNDGTNSGATPNVAGKINTAYDFEESQEDVITIPSDATLNITPNISISFWAKIESLAPKYYPRRFLSKSGAFEITNREDELRWTCAGNCYLLDGVLSTGSWIHVVVTYNGATQRIYIDGNQNNNAFEGTLGTANTILYIGRYHGGVNYDYDGLLDEIGIWDKELTQAEVTELYNSGNGLAYPFAPADTCTCPGAGNNWEIDMSDYCNITDACDLTTGTLSFTGAGTTKFNSVIKTTNLGDPGANGLLKILSNCIIWIKGI